MQIYGHKLIVSAEFKWIKTRLQKGINCLYYDELMIEKAKKANLDFAILVQNKNEIFLSNALGAKFLLFEDKKLAQFAAKVAEFYLFDSKLLLIVETLNTLEKAYALGVDGVILKSFIQNFH